MLQCYNLELKMFEKIAWILFLCSVLHEGWCTADPCTTHATISGEVKRSVAYVLPANESPLCDAVWTEQWYKVDSAAGNDVITECPPTDRCGTHNPIWMNGTIPEVADGIVDRIACVSDIYACCDTSWTIQVKNCSTYQVYKLPPSNSCPEAYCFGTLYITTPTPSTTSTTTTTPTTTTGTATSEVPSQHPDSTTHRKRKEKEKKNSLWIVLVVCLTVIVVVSIISFTIYRICQTIKNKVEDGEVRWVSLVKQCPVSYYERPQNLPPSYQETTRTESSTSIGIPCNVITENLPTEHI